VTGDPRIPEVPIDAATAPFGTGLGDIDLTGGSEQETPVVFVPAEEHDKVVAERDEYLDTLQRLKAEFDNYRRRVDRDRELQHHAGVRDLVGELLPVIDNLERAIAALGGESDQIVAGVEMVRGQLAGLLSGRGVEEIQAHSRAFDPTLHEAVAQHPTDEHDEGTVVHVAEKGYRLGKTVLRPAKVIVAARPPEPEGSRDGP
jgi:molecular chaperone GrpE